MHAQPRQEYPRPQFVREHWQNLNGEWEFDFDDDNVGIGQRWFSGGPLARRINVPFAFQSSLSGLGTHEFHDVVWYRKVLSLPADAAGKRAWLHFGAIDYSATVWVNGELVATHEGGHTPFSVELTRDLRADSHVIVVRAEDRTDCLDQPRGKQYWEAQSASIFYTRTTGIWQTVWLEFVAPVFMESARLTPDYDRREVRVEMVISRPLHGDGMRAAPIALETVIRMRGEVVARQSVPVAGESATQVISLPARVRRTGGPGPDAYEWSPEHPNLFDVTFTLHGDGGQEIDRVESYFGLRKIAVEGGKVLLNNHAFYMKLVLDQGYFPDGILTPPSDEAIRRDVELTKQMGFNGARKHQKVEDPRYLYWCDKLGLLVWGEMANSYEFSEQAVRRITQEWQDVVKRDYNHPCIVAWVPLNESWGVPNLVGDARQRAHISSLYYLTKSLDSTRPVVTNDGWEHTVSDLCTLHDYDSRKTVLKTRYQDIGSALSTTPGRRLVFAPGHTYAGQPILVTEFGGISFKKSDWEGWGYSGADSDEDFIERYAAVVEAMLESPTIQGFCYTQLTDVEQEINGLLTYDREPKVPLDVIRRINEGRADSR